MSPGPEILGPAPKPVPSLWETSGVLCILSALASLSESQGDEGNDASLHAALTVACPPTRLWAGEREVCDGEELWAQGISKLPVTQQGPKCLCLMICKFVWEDVGGGCVASGGRFRDRNTEGGAAGSAEPLGEVLSVHL